MQYIPALSQILRLLALTAATTNGYLGFGCGVHVMLGRVVGRAGARFVVLFF
jgi:hypothetical protein